MNQYKLQQEIYDFLANKISVPVFDEVPKNKRGDYVKIGNTVSNPHFTDNSFGSDNVCTIHIYANNKGKERLKLIMKEIFDILNRNDDFPSTGIYCEYQQTLPENDGNYVKGIMRFRILKEID